MSEQTGQLSQRAIGICLLLCVISLWTASSFLTSNILVGAETYDKPFLITWLCTASFTFYLVPWYARQLIRGQSHDRHKREASDASYAPLPDTDNLDGSGQPGKLPPLTTRETARAGFRFCFFWFIANYSMNASLSLTTVSSMTVLSSTSGLFTLAIGRIAGVETFTLVKLLAVIMSIIGVAMVSGSDSAVSAAADGSINRERLLGDALALGSAFLYGVYVIFLKLTIPDESRINMPAFFGFVGATNVLCLWPFGVLLHLFGIERFALPPNSTILVSLLINAGITFVSDYLYILALLKTSPLLVTVGLSLTIPAAVFGDFFYKATPVGNMLLFLVGAAFVVSAFIVVGIKGDVEPTPLLRDERVQPSEDDP